MLNRQLSQSLEVDVNRFGVQIVACSCQVGQHGVQSVHVQTGRSLCVFCLPWYLSGVPQNKQCSLSETQNWQIDAHAQCMPLEPPVQSYRRFLMSRSIDSWEQKSFLHLVCTICPGATLISACRRSFALLIPSHPLAPNFVVRLPLPRDSLQKTQSSMLLANLKRKNKRLLDVNCPNLCI